MEYRTEYTRYIVCPYCGNESRNTEGIDESSVRVVCDECWNEFWVSASYSTSYSTEKVDWKLDGEKKIDRCKDCSQFNINEKEGNPYSTPGENPFRYPEFSCNKSSKNILTDPDDNIESFCELPDTEPPDWKKEGECDTDNDDQGGYDSWAWSKLHDTD